MIDLVTEYHEKFYEKVHGGGCTGRANLGLHRDLERRHGPETHYAKVLELGAGAGQHLEYVRHGYDVYLATDLLTPSNLDGWETVPSGTVPPSPGRYFSPVDAQSLPYPDDSFDRLVATCLLLHLSEPYTALQEWRRVVRPGGALDILIPCDPGLTVRSFRSVVTRRRARKFGCTNFGLVNAIEHKNHVYGLLKICAHVFRDDTVRRAWRPLPGIPAWNLNTHLFLQVTRAAGPVTTS